MKAILQTSGKSCPDAFRLAPYPAKALQTSAKSCRETLKSWIELGPFSEKGDFLPPTVAPEGAVLNLVHSCVVWLPPEMTMPKTIA
jgi:hypothetical protein